MQIYRSLDEVKEAGTIAPDSIVNADCLEAMKFIPDNSIDAIICDLPYGVTNCHWDSVIPFDLLWEQYKRIIKPNGAIALFGSQPFTSALVMSNPKWFKYEWIWDKNLPTGFATAKHQPMKAHENIVIFYQNRPTYSPQKTSSKILDRKLGGSNGIRGKAKNRGAYRIGTKQEEQLLKINVNPRSTLCIPCVPRATGTLHPTQKPVPLIEYLIKTYTIEGELILDNTSGSGTLAIAAININRRYILIEKDPEYFQVSCDRVANHDPNALTTPKKAKKPRAITEGQLAFFG